LNTAAAVALAFQMEQRSPPVLVGREHHVPPDERELVDGQVVSRCQVLDRAEALVGLDARADEVPLVGFVAGLLLGPPVQEAEPVPRSAVGRGIFLG